MREPSYSLALMKEISQVSYRQAKHNASFNRYVMCPLYVEHSGKVSDFISFMQEKRNIFVIAGKDCKWREEPQTRKSKKNIEAFGRMEIML